VNFSYIDDGYEKYRKYKNIAIKIRIYFFRN